MPPFLDQLAAFWAYTVLGAVSIIVEEFAPVTGGVAAHERHLVLVWVALSCALGSWLADIGLYFLGRWRGMWVRKRWPRLGRALTRTLLGVRRAPWRSSLAVRYAYGLRLTLPIACGAAHVPLAEYLAGSGISAFTWASLFTVLGWVFGRSAELVMRHMRRYEDVIGLALAGLAGVLVLLYVRRTGHRDEDPAVRAFERELDVLSGEYVAVDEDTIAPLSDRDASAGDSARLPDDDADARRRRGKRRA
jgi:membrane protein DedA with SNARE-associated domain